MDNNNSGCGAIVTLFICILLCIAAFDSCTSDGPTSIFDGMSDTEIINKKWQMLENNQNW